MFLPVADTMVIDLSRQEIYLTWRLTIPDFFGMKEGVLSCIIPECIGKKILWVTIISGMVNVDLESCVLHQMYVK